MACIAGKKWPVLIFTVYLLLSVGGATAFAMSESLFFDNATESSRTGSNNYYFKKHNIDWLACEAVSITKARESSSSVLRYAALRFFTTDEFNNRSECPAESSFQTVTDNYVPNIKNTILLKLRL